MSAYDPAPAAAALHDIRSKRGIVRPLPASIAPQTEADGAAAQHALAVLIGEPRPAGFKIGATGKRMQEYLGLSGPAAGFMAAANVHRVSADLRFADYIRPGVECEVAVCLARDLPPGPCSQAEAAAAVGAFMAGIEIVENRYDDILTLGTPTLIADQVYHVAAVIGEEGPTDWRQRDVGALRGRITATDGQHDEGITADLLGHPFNGLAWLAGSSVAAAFGGLRAGQVVMLGSVTPPLWLTGPTTVEVAFDGLPTVRVRLA
ncbi:MAG TPA: fumarylacetoacetate hydrolase family protein [Acetobacteraceae bacterium]|nr:fumarylacetoacetate hydrolase family protein [Acetobacteraceae bacterium]